VVAWSHLEHRVSDFFIALTESNPGSMIVVTANVSQNTITGWIRTLLDVYALPEDLTEEIRETLDEVDYLRAQRNALVHGHWTTSSEPGSAAVQTMRLERSFIANSLVVTPDDLCGLMREIQDVTIKLRDLFGRLPRSPES